MRQTLAFVPDAEIEMGRLPNHGWLCVKYTDSHYIKPEMTVLYWPIMHGYRPDFQETFPELDTDAELHGDRGAYTFYRGLGHYSPILTLKDGGKTKPIKSETFPIPCPKVRKGIETRFERGYWQKYLKSEGWVAA
jgi:hypothetical protein